MDLHPEELLDRVRNGSASVDERERVAIHLATCEACRFEHDLLVGPASRGERRRARRLARSALAALGARGTISRTPARSKGARALTVATAVALVATASAAAVLLDRARFRQPESAPAARAPAVSPVVSRPPPRHSPPPESPRTAPPEVPARPPAAEPDRAPSIAAPPTRKAPETESAAELFARANRARREGATGEALRLYRELSHAHPGSAEERVSRVAAGRLLLDRVGDSAGALAAFDSYLQSSGDRTLREEALVGRALALGRMGEAEAERAAWNRLLSAYPKSAYADRARARIASLR